MTDQRRQSVYIPTELLEEMRAEAARLDRSLSWIIQQAWKFSRVRIRQFGAPSSVAQPLAEGKKP